MVIFISVRDDRAQEKLAQCKLKNSAEALQVMTQDLQAGLAAFTTWANTSQGQVLETTGDIVISTQAENLPDLKDVKYSYEQLTGNTVSIGIGITILDSAKALEVASYQTDTTVFYTEDCDRVLEERKKLKKAEGHGHQEKRLDANTINSPVPPIEPNSPPEEVPTPLNVEAIQRHLKIDPPKQTAFHGKLLDLAMPAQAQPQVSPYEAAKGNLGQALALLQDQSAALEELRVLNPQLYQGINELALTVISLARQFTAEAGVASPQLAKSGAKSPVQKISGMVESKLKDHDCKSGACYHATEAMYHLLGGKQAGFVPHVENQHWSLKNQQTGKSYLGHTPNAKPRKLASDNPSAQAMDIIDEVIRNGPVSKSLDEEELVKFYLPKPKKPRSRSYVKVPLGTVKNGRMKVLHRDGTVGFKTVKAGMVQSKTDAMPLMGANSHPASPKEPYSGKD